MHKFKTKELEVMTKNGLILLITQLYATIDDLGEMPKQKSNTGVYMQGTSKKVSRFYDKTLKEIEQGGE